MKKASQILSDDQREQINQAVEAAERKTSAEIVPVLATASGRYDRPEDLIGVWVALVALSAAWVALPAGETDGSWGGWQAWWSLPILMLAVVVGFLLGAVIASRIDWLRRLATTRREMREEVENAARGMFYSARIGKTREATGLLVYVSLYEQTAMLLADDAVLTALGQDGLNQLRDTLVEKLRSDVAGAFCETIAAAGDKLGVPLPRAADDVDELPNALVVID